MPAHRTSEMAEFAWTLERAYRRHKRNGVLELAVCEIKVLCLIAGIQPPKDLNTRMRNSARRLAERGIELSWYVRQSDVRKAYAGNRKRRVYVLRGKTSETD